MQAVVGSKTENPHVLEVTIRTSVAVDKAVGRIREVDGSVGAQHAVVGRVQPLSHVLVDQHGLLLGGEIDAVDGASARSGDDETAASQDQAVGTGLANG